MENSNNYNSNQNRFVKKMDLKMFLIISAWINLILLMIVIYQFSIPLDQKVKSLYLENQATYKVLVNIKSFLN